MNGVHYNTGRTLHGISPSAQSRFTVNSLPSSADIGEVKYLISDERIHKYTSEGWVSCPLPTKLSELLDDVGYALDSSLNALDERVVLAETEISRIDASLSDTQSLVDINVLNIDDLYTRDTTQATQISAIDTRLSVGEDAIAQNAFYITDLYEENNAQDLRISGLDASMNVAFTKNDFQDTLIEANATEIASIKTNYLQPADVKGNDLMIETTVVGEDVYIDPHLGGFTFQTTTGAQPVADIGTVDDFKLVVEATPENPTVPNRRRLVAHDGTTGYRDVRDWLGLQNRPDEFPAESHTHLWVDITDKPLTFNPTTHGHDWSEITNTPLTFTPSTHGHDWSEITNTPLTFTPSTHGHDWSEITNTPLTFTPSTHGHDWSEITNTPLTFDSELLVKGGTIPTYTDVSGINFLSSRAWIDNGELQVEPQVLLYLTPAGDPNPLYIEPTTTESSGAGFHILTDGSGLSLDFRESSLTFQLSENLTTLRSDIDSHNHDASYSSINHNHDASYSAINHNHDASYSAINHNHDASYSLINHNHDASYSLINHHHEAIYYNKGISDARYAFDDHNHTGIYANATHGHTWSEITSKPTTFTPSTHGHAWSEITNTPLTFTPSTHGHTWSEITSKPTTFTPSTHGHAWSEITSKPTTFTPSTHGHAWSEITSKPTTFTPSTHGHAWSEITNTPLTFTPSTHGHTWSEITSKPTTFAPSSHTHSVSDINSTTGTLTLDTLNANGSVNAQNITAYGNTYMCATVGGDAWVRAPVGTTGKLEVWANTSSNGNPWYQHGIFLRTKYNDVVDSNTKDDDGDTWICRRKHTTDATNASASDDSVVFHMSTQAKYIFMSSGGFNLAEYRGATHKDGAGIRMYRNVSMDDGCNITGSLKINQSNSHILDHNNIQKYASLSHNHDDLYYTKSEINTSISTGTLTCSNTATFNNIVNVNSKLNADTLDCLGIDFRVYESNNKPRVEVFSNGDATWWNNGFFLRSKWWNGSSTSYDSGETFISRRQNGSDNYNLFHTIADSEWRFLSVGGVTNVTIRSHANADSNRLQVHGNAKIDGLLTMPSFSTIRMNGGSYLDIENGAVNTVKQLGQIKVNNGGYITLDSGANFDCHATARFKVPLGGTAPISPSNGLTYFDTVALKLKTYYNGNWY